jgi:hypothetical protein
MGLSLATAAFWLFLAVVVGSLIWRKGLHRREVLITLRAAIEKGVPLDDERLQALLDAAGGKRANSRASVSHDLFLVLGALTGGVGLCFAILAFLAPGPDPLPIVFLAICAGVMAATLLVLWRIFARRAKHDGAERR